MAPRDVPAVGGDTSGWVATSEWGSCGPLPTLATMMLPGVIGWRSPTSGTLSARWGWNLLKTGPPQPRAQVALALPTPVELRILGLIFTPRGVEKELKIF